MRACGRLWPSEEAASHSKLVLAGSHVPEPCAYGCEGGWHITRAAKAAKAVKTAAAADTGPDRATRALVLTRDGYRCVRCGIPCGPGIAEYSLQHRKARGVGGDSSAPNLILFHGSATTGCHAEVERRGAHDNAAGYWLASWQDPATEGVMYASEDGGVTFYLEADGALTVDAPASVTT